jgi:hypothetical protein
MVVKGGTLRYLRRVRRKLLEKALLHPYTPRICGICPANIFHCSYDRGIAITIDEKHSQKGENKRRVWYLQTLLYLIKVGPSTLRSRASGATRTEWPFGPKGPVLSQILPISVHFGL